MNSPIKLFTLPDGKIFEIYYDELALNPRRQYLEGNVYRFVLLSAPDSRNDRTVLESCGGFYGQDVETNGMLDYVPADVGRAIKNQLHQNMTV